MLASLSLSNAALAETGAALEQTMAVVTGAADDGYRPSPPSSTFRDLSTIEQVEVVKGPASVLFGRGSSGGMINRITKKPTMDRSEVSVQAGGWGQKCAVRRGIRQAEQGPVGVLASQRGDRFIVQPRCTGCAVHRRWIFKVGSAYVQDLVQWKALAVNNADIAPELTKNKKVGAKYDLLDGHASAGVSVFQLVRPTVRYRF